MSVAVRVTNQIEEISRPLLTKEMAFRFRMVRMRFLWSQGVAGEKLGISQHQVSKFEKAQMEIAPFTVAALRKAFTVRANYILLGIGDPKWDQNETVRLYWAANAENYKRPSEGAKPPKGHGARDFWNKYWREYWRGKLLDKSGNDT